MMELLRKIAVSIFVIPLIALAYAVVEGGAALRDCWREVWR